MTATRSQHTRARNFCHSFRCFDRFSSGSCTGRAFLWCVFWTFHFVALSDSWTSFNFSHLTALTDVLSSLQSRNFYQGIFQTRDFTHFCTSRSTSRGRHWRNSESASFQTIFDCCSCMADATSCRFSCKTQRSDVSQSHRCFLFETLTARLTSFLSDLRRINNRTTTRFNRRGCSTFDCFSRTFRTSFSTEDACF